MGLPATAALLTQGPVAFPWIGSQSTGTSASGTTVNINLPANILAGDLLLLMIKVTAGTITTPSGFTQIDTAAGGGGVGVWNLYRKTAAGSEGATLSVVTSNNTARLYTCLKIRNWQGTPEIATATASGTSLDPGNLTPSWGSDQNLWVVFGHSGFSISGSLSGYTAITTPTLSAAAWKHAEATSDDPPTGWTTTSNTWRTITVAVRGP